MKKLVIVVGGDMGQDLRKFMKNPDKKEFGTQRVYVKTFDEVRRVLSPQKLDMLCRFSKGEFGNLTVGETAKRLNRKQEAISRDVSGLARHGLIKKTKKGRQVLLSAPFKSIEIRFS
ncbi:MAG: hypothetical protein HY394_02840 [Candidatus Diapherotrites archaeon]|nr:hypothetical protein [Candidatus Diapherotrites archaeon]